MASNFKLIDIIAYISELFPCITEFLKGRVESTLASI